MENDLPMLQIDLMTVKRLPPSLRGTIYETFLCAISEELSLWRGIIRKEKTSLYDIEAMSEERLRDIAKMLGIPLPSVLIGGVSLLQEEVRAIPFKVTHKGTVTLYKSLFLTMHRRGKVFVYTFNDGEDDIHPSLCAPWKEFDAAGIGVPFGRASLDDFSGTIVGYKTLDSGEALDGGGVSGLWRLDKGVTEISTNHLGLEYVIDRKIERDGKEYLMTREYLEYIEDNMEWGRRAKEVPHIGSQLSFALYGNGVPCDIPSIGLCAITDAAFFEKVHSRQDIQSVEFGVGAQNISNGIPAVLDSRICTVKSDYIAVRENEAGDIKSIAISGTYDGQCVSDITVLDAFDGTAKSFDFVLPHSPIRKGSVRLSLIETSTEVLEARDDGNGTFVSNWCTGGIDYATGQCHLSTVFEHSLTANIIDASSAIEGHYRFTGILASGGIIQDSALLSFSMDGRAYTVRDSNNGDGTASFLSEMIYQSSLNYATGEFDITFTKDVDVPPEYKITCRYSHPSSFIPPAGSVLDASYLFTENTVLITEAGIRGVDGSLIAYATFPPFEFTSNAYHLSLNVVVQKAQ